MAASFGHVADQIAPARARRACAARRRRRRRRSSSSGGRRRRRSGVDGRGRQRRAWTSASSRSWSVTSAASAATSGDSMRRGRSMSTSKLAVTRPGPGRQDDDAVAEPGRLADVVGDEQHGQAAVAHERVELVVQHVAGHRVEGAERLVHQQDVGVLGERPGQRRPLAHAAGQLVRALVGEPVEVDRRRAARSARSPALGLGDAGEAHRQLDVGRRRSATGTAPTPGTSAPCGRRRRPCPPVGVSSPATRLRIVDLPQPEAPTRQTNSPGCDLEVDVARAR